MSDVSKTGFWGHQMNDLVAEIVHQAAACHVKLLDPGVLDAVVRNNESVCGHDNPRAFRKLRELLMMGFIVKEKSVDRLGPMETEELVEAIREQLKQHPGFGA